MHLRGGKVARGGIRWSDRREDFRTEVLGLMKAQMVKNVVIVPVGAKGGFVVKRPPMSREALAEEVVACYRTFMSGLLDLTDNRQGDQVIPPVDVVRYDDDDPYLVVAADKGTATFSDIANSISLERGFWLGDAFASGGSAGYDHKEMGITARGAWESVKRHFRNLGTDIQSTDVTVVGIGDMSGDVFGNGMILSRHLKLIGAFNHLHVFLDPHPDPETSFQERERLFGLPRSTWEDYDPNLISKGGGVWPRTVQVDPFVARGPSDAQGGRPADDAQRVDPCLTRRTGRSAVERGDRDLRQGIDRDPRRCRRQGERPGPHRCNRVEGTGGGRGRQPRLHPTGAGGVRPIRGTDQHRRHRQLGRRRLFRPRGQHQDPARCRRGGR